MSDELFEVAFSGEIVDGADLAQVKAKVGAMFKADETKLAHLFSGKRMVIKKNIDQATANKYKAALNNAGAVCEIKSLSAAAAPQAEAPVVAPAAETAQPAVEKTNTPAPATASTAAVASGDAPEAPQTDPLGITANDISDLSVGIAPVGSDMQDEITEVSAPDLDVSGLDMAPAGSELGQVKKEDEATVPDTSGMSLVE